MHQSVLRKCAKYHDCLFKILGLVTVNLYIVNSRFLFLVFYSRCFRILYELIDYLIKSFY